MTADQEGAGEKPPSAQTSEQRPGSSGALRFLLPLLAILGCWGAYGLHRLNTFTLGLNSIHEPTLDSLLLALVLSAVGIPATYLVYRTLLCGLTPGSQLLIGVRQLLHDGDRRTALWALGLLGALVPLFVRYVVLHEAPLTDDEASYSFAAQLLARGRLWVPSPHMPVFFDNGFIVNDGKFYSQYFLGWPAFLAIGEFLHVPGLINPILSGFTTVFLTIAAERRFGPAWGRVAGLLYIASPFMAVSAALLMSHIAACFWLSLLLLCVDAVIDHDASWRTSILIALAAGGAFFVRPATGLGFGAPLVLAWLFHVLRKKGGWRHLLAFTLMAAIPALLFLWVNESQTGSPWKTGYHAAYEHAEATRYRFVSFRASTVKADSFFYFFVQTDEKEIVTKFVTVLLRLWHDVWGFPIGLSLALFTPRKGAKRLIGAFVGLMLAHIPLPDAGVDTFGPVHYTELVLLLTIATTGGLQRIHQFALRLGAPGAAPALLAACMACGAIFYGIPRFTTLTLLASDILAPIEAFNSAPPHSIIFNRYPFAPLCLAKPASHFVFMRPNNDPNQQNERLWANHLDLETDRKLLASKPGWRGFLIRHDTVKCTSTLVPIEEASRWEFPQTRYLMPGDLSEVPRPRPR